MYIVRGLRNILINFKTRKKDLLKSIGTFPVTNLCFIFCEYAVCLVCSIYIISICVSWLSFVYLVFSAWSLVYIKTGLGDVHIVDTASFNILNVLVHIFTRMYFY